MELHETSRIDLQIPSCVVTLVEQEENLHQIIEMRKQLSERIGFQIAPIHIHDNSKLLENELVVFVDKKEHCHKQFQEKISIDTMVNTLSQTIQDLSYISR